MEKLFDATDDELTRLRGLLERWVKEIEGIECWSDDCPELRPLVDATKAALAAAKPERRGT
jgi:hypothetical protein